MTSNAPERVNFPCDYPIKVMVRVEHGVRSHVDAIVEQHAGPLDPAAVTEYNAVGDCICKLDESCSV